MTTEDYQMHTLAAFRSIDATLKELLTLSKSKRAAASQPATTSVDLDGAYGDPEIKAKSPREWTGEPMRGRKFSQCPPAYLRLVADRLDYFAGKEPDPKKADYNRLDAARARQWADRLDSGWTPPAEPAIETGEMPDEKEIPW